MNKRNKKGFTLIELLVATGVTAIIAGLMIQMVSNLLTAYNRSSGALSAQSQSAFVLDQISSEIESLVLRNTTDVMLVASVVENPSGYEWSNSAKPTGGSLVIPAVAPANIFEPQEPIENLRFGQGGVFLRYITAAPTLSNDPNSGVRVVGYQIQLDGVTDAGGAPLQYMLYRTEIPALETFTDGYNLDPTDGDYVSNTALIQPDENDIVAGNVVDFGVRFFETSSSTANKSQRGLLFPLDSSDVEYNAAGSGAEQYPDVIEVMIRILTPEGERLLAAKRDPLTSASVPQAWWDIVLQNSVVFSRVINIPSRPL